MNESAFIRFVGVVRRSRTWLGVLYHWLAFPLGLFYFVFLVTGLSVGVGLVVVWVGIPILLVVAGAWWLFGAFERWQARVMLGADVPAPPREWERVEGIWAKLRAHFGSGATWKDLLYLVVKMPLGIVSFTLLVTGLGMVFWFLAMPVFAINDVPVVNGTWVPPLWFGILSVPIGILVFIVALHVLNAWGWVCARWAELMFRGPEAATPVAPQAPLAGAVPPASPVAPQAPVAEATSAASPPPFQAPVTPPVPPASPTPPAQAAATPQPAALPGPATTPVPVAAEPAPETPAPATPAPPAPGSEPAPETPAPATPAPPAPGSEPAPETPAPAAPAAEPAPETPAPPAPAAEPAPATSAAPPSAPGSAPEAPTPSDDKTAS